MKTTFKNAFTNFEDDIININESTVCEDTGIASADIKANVLSQLGLKNKKKPFGKSFKITVTAATLAAVLTVSTTAINANGGMQIVFEEFFGGNMNSAGLYDGGEVTFTSSDPNLNVEMLGMTGDDHGIYAVLKATKKDGSTFTDEGYINPIMSVDEEGVDSYLSGLNDNPPETPGELISAMASYDGLIVVCKDRNGNDLGSGNDGITGIVPKYYLSEDRTMIKIFINVSTYRQDFRDGTMTVKSTGFTARKNIQTIAVYDNAGEETWNDFLEKCKELNIDDRDCMTLYTPNEVIHCLADKKEYSLPFEMTFKMNYRNNNNIKKSLSLNDAPHFIQKTTQNVQLTVSSFGVYITGESEWQGNFHNCFQTLDDQNSKVIMNDGTEYYFVAWGGGASGGVETGLYEEQTLTYSPILNPTYFLEDTLIDTREIKTIILNGDTIYSK